MSKEKEIIPHLFRTEYSKIVAVLCKTYGIATIQLAEDLVSETFLVATETWGTKGIPEFPKAWLYQVAKNNAKNYFKRHTIYQEKVRPALKENINEGGPMAIDLSEKHIKDSQLQMVFAVCTPLLSTSSQICLALKILCGFGVNEIATALLSNKVTIRKRLFRAKEKLRNSGQELGFPQEKEITARLDNVLNIIYLLFNEGYYSSTSDKAIQKDLCFQAMQLVMVLLDYPPTNLPKTNALMALLCFQSSRIPARLNEHGDFILYANQNRELWNKDLIGKGTLFLNRSSQGKLLSKFHLEAAIAYWHSRNEDEKKWENILQYYNLLLQIEYSPIIALNRTYALAKARGSEIALKEALKIDLKANHLYHMLLSELYLDQNREKATSHAKIALTLAKTLADRNLINSKLATLRKDN